MKSLGVLTLTLFSFCGSAQSIEPLPLFQHDEPLNVKFSYSMKQVARNTSDSVYFPSMLQWSTDSVSWDSLAIGLRARGNFRRRNCFFAPLRIKIKKSQSKETVFFGNKSLKVVLPCKNAKLNDDLILKEYICYQLYNVVTPASFRVRLANITLTDVSRKVPRSYTVRGFFIEDDDILATRLDGKIIETEMHPISLHDSSSVRQAMFEYMIANTDWSTTYHHNMKVVHAGQRKYIPVGYDFDMAGLVDAPYASLTESVDLISVRQRLYRGFCRDEALTQSVRAEFIRLEPALLAVVDRYSNYLDAKEIAGMKKYLGEFFDILKDDDKFRENVLKKCRMP